jgi:uncharacterized Fe-S cluster-containing radical SAM superfamily enzyme
MTAKVEFETLRFNERDDVIRVFLYKIFYFDIPKVEIEKIGEYKVHETYIEFPLESMKKVDKKFNFLIGEYINDLKNSIGDKKSVYVHKNSGIPLIGNGAFGIVDRGTNLIEIKPITGCNLECVYCSINEPQKAVDFVVEPEYMIEELRKVIELKKSEQIEIHIGCQGEPLLYDPLVELVQGIKTINRVHKISMDTNACLLTKEKANKLIRAGMNQFNISINTLDDNISKKMANGTYSIVKAREITDYISKKVDVNIAPVLVPSFNDKKDMDELCQYVVDLQKLSRFKVQLTIQKFLSYQFGKKPVGEEPWDNFYEKLKKLEKKYKIKLIFDASDFSIKKDDSLPKPFKKNDVVKAIIECSGRQPGEKIAVAEGRCISVAKCSKESGSVKVKILRDKHNIFFGTEV